MLDSPELLMMYAISTNNVSFAPLLPQFLSVPFLTFF